MTPRAEMPGDGVRDLADPELEGATVGRVPCHLFTDGRRRIVWSVGDWRWKCNVNFERQVDVGHVDYGITGGVRHVPVHLGDNEPAASTDLLDGGGKDVHLDAERHLAPPRGGRVDENGVGRPQGGEE